jgi:hypothetical protein
MAQTIEQTARAFKVERDSLAQHLTDMLDGMGGPDSLDTIRSARKALALIYGEREQVDAFGCPRRTVRMVAYDYNGRS